MKRSNNDLSGYHKKLLIIFHIKNCLPKDEIETDSGKDVLTITIISMENDPKAPKSINNL